MAKIVQAKVEPLPSHKKPGALALQLFAVFGAPAAWSLQLLVNYALAAEACFPNEAPLAHPTVPWDRTALIAVNLLALAVSAVAAWTAFSLWTRTSRGLGPHDDPVEIARGRTHFMAACGLLAGFGFMAAILFNTVAAVGVPQCSG